MIQRGKNSQIYDLSVSLASQLTQQTIFLAPTSVTTCTNCLMHESKIGYGGNSPTIRAITCRFGCEYLMDNYRIAFMKTTQTLNIYIDTSDTDNHIKHIIDYRHNIKPSLYTTESQRNLRKLRKAIVETFSMRQ